MCHAGSIPDHPTSIKLTWDLEVGVSPKSVLWLASCAILPFCICYNIYAYNGVVPVHCVSNGTKYRGP